MPGKIVASVIALFMCSYFLILGFAYSIHCEVREKVDEVSYNVLEAVSTNAEFSQHLYDYLDESVQKYGDFTIALKLEEQRKTGVYDKCYSKNDILGRELHIGDRVAVYVESRDMSLFGRLINSSFMGLLEGGEFLNLKIRSLKTVVVAKNAL